jgi:hypothetical protein
LISVRYGTAEESAGNSNDGCTSITAATAAAAAVLTSLSAKTNHPSRHLPGYRESHLKPN